MMGSDISIVMISENPPHIDPYLFEKYFEAFKEFIKKESNLDFVSFASNPYTEKQEGYKYEIYRAGRKALGFSSWKQSWIGNGDIAPAVINSIEIQGNNLVPWQARYGMERRPHHRLHEAVNQRRDLRIIEKCFFRLYREQEEASSFQELISIFGKIYPLLAYFFFLKDRSRFLPLAPNYFDRAFQHLGVDFQTSHRCSWENYSVFISILSELRVLLSEKLSVEVSLLDAHSFAWILVSQMDSRNSLPDVREYFKLSSTEREAIITARIGQGQFRVNLLQYWSFCCAVTGCGEVSLLRASHIKPWSQGTLIERLSLYNGLLLCPNLDACFDAGYVSFDDDGRILISKRLKRQDAVALGIHASVRLRKISPKHKKYLMFHRKHIFK